MGQSLSPVVERGSPFPSFPGELKCVQFRAFQFEMHSNHPACQRRNVSLPFPVDILVDKISPDLFTVREGKPRDRLPVRVLQFDECRPGRPSVKVQPETSAAEHDWRGL